MDPIRHRYPRIPCYLIMDEKARKAGPICGGATSGYALNRENYKWSKDNSAEIESGVLIKADSLKELAKKINVPGETLEATVHVGTRTSTTDEGHRNSSYPQARSQGQDRFCRS